MKREGSIHLTRVLVYSILLLFFFQLIADFIEALYAFGLSQGVIPPEIALIALLLSPFLLLFFRRGLPATGLMLLAEGVLLARVVEPMLDTRGRLFVSGIGVAIFLILFPAMIWHSGQKQHRAAGVIWGISLTVAVSLSILLRVMGSGLDLSTDGFFQAIGWGLAILVAILIPKNLLTAGPVDEDMGMSQPSSRRIKIAGLSIGLIAGLTLLYFTSTSPTVLARWTGVNYLLILVVLVLTMAAFAWLISRGRWIGALRSPEALVLVTAIFIAALAFTILQYQSSFPASFSAYPLAEKQPGIAADISLMVALILFPVILLDFTALFEEAVLVRPSMPAMGLGFGLASLFLTLMILANVFTTVYDYIPLVGAVFRDKYWLVYLAVGLVLALSLFLVSGQTLEALGFMAQVKKKQARVFPITILSLGLASLVGFALVSSNPPQPIQKAELVVASYNIQQGYSEDMAKNFDGQLELLRQIDADIIGLQETDNARINGGNVDVVRYLTDRLDMHAYYGPKTVNGTFGEALLSKYFIEDPATYYLYSEGEQVAVVEGQINVDGLTYHVYVNHFGNTCRFPDQEQQLAGLKQLIAGQDNVIVLGDFNFGRAVERLSCTPEQQVIMQGFQDELLMAGLDEDDACGRLIPNDGLDHIFVSDGLNIQSDCIDDPASDHPLLWARIWSTEEAVIED